MRNLLRFIKVYHFVLLFILIESLSLFFYINNHSFQKSKFISFIGEYSSSFYNSVNNMNEYFHLKAENNNLIQENSKLRSFLVGKGNDCEQDKKIEFEFNYIPAKVIYNSVFKSNNYIRLSKGKIDGVKKGMGIVVENGVIGQVVSISENYSLAISILNQRSSVPIRHDKSNQNGNLIWNGTNYFECEINDIPNHAEINIGDTISTNGYSSVFPEGINIAIIKSYKKGNETGLYTITTKLLNDMNTIKNVYIINSLTKEEKLSIDKK